MNLPYRIDLLVRLGEYILSDAEPWQNAKERAWQENGWFVPEFTGLAAKNIAESFLQKNVLSGWANAYQLQNFNPKPRTIGLVMAGNIPLVGFHDFLCVFISGHKALVKLSSKDRVLFQHLTDKLSAWDAEGFGDSSPGTRDEPVISDLVGFGEMLKGCDAYIATGSNNSSRYFEYYFAKYPHIIRRNRTSVAVLTGNETNEELEKLADDVYLYFGLGCRNVTSLFVPKEYNFIPLLDAFKKYNYLADHHKYKNNYDYNLALHLLNKKYYMTNGSILLIEDPSLFSPISQLNYQFYDDPEKLKAKLSENMDLQCIIGRTYTPFGKSQSPAIDDYADGVDTLRFLCQL